MGDYKYHSNPYIQGAVYHTPSLTSLRSDVEPHKQKAPLLALRKVYSATVQLYECALLYSAQRINNDTSPTIL